MLRPWLRRAALVAIALVYGCVIAIALALAAIAIGLPSVSEVPREGAAPTTAFMRASRCGESLARTHRSLDEISPIAICSVVRAEDRHFFRHDGVDWPAVRSAIVDGIRRGEMRFGGSTIAMQLARNLFLSSERTVGRKARELSLAPRLVERLGRLRVLELYLNVAEWAPCRYGIEEGARWWFGHGADRMDLFEATLLAALLPRPSRPLVPDDAIQVARKQGIVMRQFAWSGMLAPEQLDRELHELDRTWRALVKTGDAEGLRAALHARAALRADPAEAIMPVTGAGWLEAECGWAP